MTTKNELLQVRIDPERLALLREYSEATGTPVSELVRRAIDTTIQRTENGKGIIWMPGSARERSREKLGADA